MVDTLKIATWNINSVRLRIALVADFLRQHAPDVLCLQETKCPDAEFPAAAFKQLGYPHLLFTGQKGYNGVAIVARRPLTLLERRLFCDRPDARHISASVPFGARAVTIHNVYAPAGGYEPDRAINPKFGHKLDFLEEMAAWCRRDRVTELDSLLVGDLNVAPLETDVWDHKALLSVVSHTPDETARLGAVLDCGWRDATRHIIPPSEKLFTWWSYRSPDWRKADKGRRLDHIWASASLIDAVKTAEIVTEARGWERPSDHVPVMALLQG